MIKIAPYLGRICKYGLIGLKTTPFSLGNVFLCQIYAQLAGLIERSYHGTDLTFTSPALNLGSRSKILASILKVRFDKFKLN